MNSTQIQFIIMFIYDILLLSYLADLLTIIFSLYQVILYGIKQSLLLQFYSFNIQISQLTYQTNKLMSYQQLKQENKKLKELRISCEDELQKLREVGRAHQNQIDTLLKFNQRLLGIIENQFNSAAKNRLSSELHPITQANQAIPELGSGDKLKSKLLPPQRIAGGMPFDQQDLQGFLDDDDQEEIYNQDSKHMSSLQKIQSAPTANKSQPLTTPQKQQFNPFNINGKVQMQKKPEIRQSKLDLVYEMHHNKEEQVSINMSTLKINSLHENHREHKAQSKEREHIETQMHHLRDMIKEYQEQFVDNSSEYEQICQIIHNDLMKDMQQFKKITYETRQKCQQKFNAIQNLKNEIKWFKPINQLVRIMKKVNIPSVTQRILYERIISKAN